MRFALLQAGVLVAIVVLLSAALVGPIERRWGPGGAAALQAAGGISLAGALAAALPLGVVLTRWPRYAPQVALAGTAIRLLVTGALALVWQTVVGVHLMSFLTCLTVFYLALLAVETVVAVLLIRRAPSRPADRRE